MTDTDAPTDPEDRPPIPDQLRSDVPTFLEVAPASKAPAPGCSERDGPFHHADDEALAAHLAEGGNVGRVLRDDLVAVDVDDPALLEYLRDLPETFTVASGGHGDGQHRYYRCPGFDASQIELADGDRNLGSVRSGHCYCLAPPSVHDETGDPYTVAVDAPVAALSADAIWDLVGSFGGDTIAIENRGSETVGGIETYVLAITHASDAVDAEVGLWFDPVSSMVVRQAASMENGSMTVDASDLAFEREDGDGPRTTEDGLSDVRTTSTVEEFREAAPFPVATPDADGWSFQRGGVAQFGPGATAIALYANGATMTVVARTDVDVLPAEVDEDATDAAGVTVTPVEDGQFVWWRADGATTVVVGDQPREALLALVDTMESP
jgi:hypothetical protein